MAEPIPEVPQKQHKPERTADQGPSGPREKSIQVLSAVQTRINDGEKPREITIEEGLAALNSIGFSVGERIVAGLQPAVALLGEKAKHSILSVPTVIGTGIIGSAFAQSNPEVAAGLGALDDVGLMALGASYCGFLALRGYLSRGQIIEPLKEELKKRINAIKADPGRKIPQISMFIAACTGALIALEDPAGAGQTITPILGAAVTFEGVNQFSEGLMETIGEEFVRRAEHGEVVDTTDPSFLTFIAITEVRKLAGKVFYDKLMGNVVDESVRRLLEYDEIADPTDPKFLVSMGITNTKDFIKKMQEKIRDLGIYRQLREHLAITPHAFIPLLAYMLAGANGTDMRLTQPETTFPNHGPRQRGGPTSHHPAKQPPKQPHIGSGIRTRM